MSFWDSLFNLLAVVVRSFKADGKHLSVCVYIYVYIFLRFIYNETDGKVNSFLKALIIKITILMKAEPEYMCFGGS